MIPKPFYRRPKRLIPLLAAVLILGYAIFVPVPYIIDGPGSAESVRARISVGDGTTPERGDFLFTTVSRISKPSLLEMAYVKATEKHSEILKEKQVLGTISNLDAYEQLVKWMRVDSESSAVIAAYHYLNRPLDIQKSGLIIRAFSSGSAASKILHEGDIITAAENQPVQELPDLAKVLQSKKPGEHVQLTIKRGDKTLQEDVPLMELDDGSGGKRTGIGFIAAQVQEAHPKEDIKFHLEDIGGPSAGLMLTLELLSKLEQKDNTHGYKVAGTGTIDSDGNVGQIGGIQFKLVAADREKAEYFFVPKDLDPGSSNQKEAEAFLKTYHSSMKLVPVGTLKEAADFLATLPEKP